MMEPVKNERGQALMEFVITLPILIFFVWYMMHINMAINKSLVGQKHARSQVFLQLLNHMNGPQSYYTATKRSAFWIGVSGDVVGDAEERQPAPTVMMGEGFKPQPKPGTNDDPEEPELGSLRQRIRVRTAFGICTHQKRLRNGPGYTDYCAAEN